MTPTDDLSDVPTINAVTLAAAPIAFSIFTPGADFLLANWGANGETRRTRNIGCATFTIPSFTNPITQTGTGTSALFSGLNPQTIYYGQVGALNRMGIPTVIANLGPVQTLDSNHLVAPPTNLTMVLVSSNALTFMWDYVDSNQTGFQVDRSFDGQSWNLLVTQLKPDIRAFNDTSVFPDVRYFYRVSAYNDVATSQPTPTISTATFAADPTHLSNSFTANLSSITVRWGRDGNPLDTHYQLRWAADPFDSFTEQAAVVGSSDSVQNLAANTTYQVDVRALNRDGHPTDWDWNNFGRIATLADTPQALTVSNVEISSATFTYNPGANPNGTTFEIQVSALADFSTIQVSRLTTNPGSYDLTGLSGGITYYARIRAINFAGQPSAFSNFSNSNPNPDSFTTNTGPAFSPNPPTAPSITSLDNGSISLTWDTVLIADVQPANSKKRVIC